MGDFTTGLDASRAATRKIPVIMSNKADRVGSAILTKSANMVYWIERANDELVDSI